MLLKKLIKLIKLTTLGLLLSCGDDAKPKPADAPATGQQVSGGESRRSEPKQDNPATPAASGNWNDQAGVTEQLGLQSYKSWYAEPSVHRSTGPHGQVRTFLNEVLEASLRQGNSVHPVGSVAVKELYDSTGTNITGYAVETKITAGNTGNDWYWYEDLGANDGRVEFSGVGLSTCTGCHAQGIDFVTTNVQ